MGNQNNINITSVSKENLINRKSVTNKVKTSNNINFFLDMLAFPEEEKIIVSTPQSLMIFESITFKLIQTLEITNLKVLQNINKNKNIKNGIDRIYSFYASKGGSWACIYLYQINFNDYTIYTQEIIRKHMPKYYFLNFFPLSTNLIVIAFNKGTIMIFDEPNISENNECNDNNSLIDSNINNDNNYINNINNGYKFNKNKKKNNSNDNKSYYKKYPIEKERQLFKFKNEIVMEEQQESCGFFEVSDTCFIGITSMGGLRFYDYLENKNEFVVNNYMQGFWANPHSKNSIVLLGNKLICVYKGITIIDVNKRLITKHIKSDNINGGIIYLRNETILLVSDYVINLKTKNMKRIILLSQYIIAEETINENGKKQFDQYNFSSGDLDGFSKEKELTLVSEKSIPQTECNLITNSIEYLNKIITFSSQEINIIQ
jgi:hypothetical protein